MTDLRDHDAPILAITMGGIRTEVAERSAGWEARVALLAGELRARRLARGGVVALHARRPGQRT